MKPIGIKVEIIIIHEIRNEDNWYNNKCVTNVVKINKIDGTANIKSTEKFDSANH